MTYWVSHPKFTGRVETNDATGQELIVDTPPVWRQFIGQPFGRLLGWLRGLGPGLDYRITGS